MASSADECRYSDRFGKPIDDVFRKSRCMETKNAEAECEKDPNCDMFAQPEGSTQTCFYSATATQIQDDRNFAGEGTTRYKDCSGMIAKFLETIEEDGDADEAQKAVAQAMIDAIQDAGNVRMKERIDEEKWAEAEEKAKDLSLCEVKQGEYRCDFDVYDPQFRDGGVVKCDEIIDMDGKQESVGLYSAIRGLTEEQCLRRCDADGNCTGVAYWQTGLRAQTLNTAQFFADMNDPTIMARKDTCEFWVGDDRGEEGVCLQDKRRDTEVRVVVLDTTGLVREYDTMPYHKEHLERALKVGKMEGTCKVVPNENFVRNSPTDTSLEYRLEGCAMIVVKFFDSSSGESQIVSERIMEDAVTSQSNRWRYVGDGECRTQSGAHEILREYVSDAKFAIASPGSGYMEGDFLTVAGGNNDAFLTVTRTSPSGGIVEFQISESSSSSGTGYVGGETYLLSGGMGSGGRVEMTEMSMAQCQTKCGQDELCTAMAFDEDEATGGTVCRLYKGKYAYTKVAPGGTTFSPNDFTEEAQGKCQDGEGGRFLAKDDIGRSVVTMRKGEEEKCLQRCESMPGCRSVNMKTEGESLVCKTLGTCNVEASTRQSTNWRFANLRPGNGVPVHFPKVQAIDKRTCRKGRSKRECTSTRDWLRFYKKMVPGCGTGEIRICTMDDKRSCSAKTSQAECDASGACSWDGAACSHDRAKCPIPGESPITSDFATEACRTSLAKYMGGRFVGIDGDERGRICPPSERGTIPAAEESVCRKLCEDEPECRYYTFFPGKGGAMGACAVHRAEECETMISSSFAREGAVSNEKVYDLSVDEAIVASSQEQCWAKEVKSDVASSMLITPEFKGDDFVHGSSRCVLLGDREICATVNTRRDEKECPLFDLPCYSGYKGGCVATDAETGQCPTLAIPRDHRDEILRSVAQEKVSCNKATSRTECSVIDSAIVDTFALVDPVEGIPIETLFLSDESGNSMESASSPVVQRRKNGEDELSGLPKRYGHMVNDFVDNAKVEGHAVKCTLPLDSNTYLMMLDSADGIDSQKGIVEALVSAEGGRNVSMRSSGERCRADADCAPTATDSAVCLTALTEEECTDPGCAWDGVLCKARHGKCDTTGEYSCHGRCLADGADPLKTRDENCYADPAEKSASCDGILQRIANAIRPKRKVHGHTRHRRKRPKKQPNGGSCRRAADCANGVCEGGFCGGPEAKRALGEACSSAAACADGLRCATDGPCAGLCQDEKGSCAGGFIPLSSEDFGGMMDLDMFGCVPRTTSAEDAASRCAQSLPVDPAQPDVKRCNAFLRFEDRHPGELSGKTCFYEHVADEVNASLLEDWEIRRAGQGEGQGASGNFYVRNVTQPLPSSVASSSSSSSSIRSSRSVRPKRMGPVEAVAIAPGCAAERDALATILQSIDAPVGSTVDTDVDEALASSVALPAEYDEDPCNADGRCCPSNDYMRSGNVCYGKEGRVNGTRCRLGEIAMPNSARKRFDLLLRLLDGESGCTVDGETLKVLVNSSLHDNAFRDVPSFSNEEELRQRGGFMRTVDNRFDVLDFRPGFQQLGKSGQKDLLQRVISTVVPECPSIADRLAMARRRHATGSQQASEKRGPNVLMVTAMLIVGIALGAARAKKKVSNEVLGGYGALCAIVLLLSM